VPRQLPTAVRNFTGRAGELAALQLLLEQAGAGGYAMPIAAIGGTAGVGKTALAVHWAHKVAARFHDGQLYVDLHGHSPVGEPLAPTAALRSFLDALGIEPAHQPAGLEEQAALYRSILADRTMLVVLDNARDAEQVRLLLPGTPACLTVVTSRGEITALAARHGAALLTLDVLTTPEAVQLLAGRLGQDRVAAEPAAVVALTELCARLPLALGIAAARAAARSGMPLAMLTEELRDIPERLDGLDAGEEASDVRAVFSWSFRSLTAPAARLFCLLGVHPGPDISLGAAASLAGLAPRGTRTLIDELIRAGLLHEHVRHRYICHDLLRAYAMERARVAEHQPDAIDCRAAVQRALDFYLHTAHAAAALVDPAQHSRTLAAPKRGTAAQWCTDRAAALSWFDAERRVLLAATAQAAELGFDSHAWQLPCALASYLDLRAYWSDWAATQRIALAAAQRLGDEVGQAHANRSIGCAYSRLGSHEDALAHMREAANLFERLGDQVAVARCCLNIAHTFERQHRYLEALGYSEQTLDLARAAGAKMELAAALNAIGWCRIHIGDYEAAVPACQEALSICRTLGDLRREAAVLDSLGHAYQCLGQHAKAIACCVRSAGLSRRVGDRFLESEALAHLGDAQHAIGRVGLARDSWQHALSILDELHDGSASEVRSKLRQIGSDAKLG
jgi:tetratricopeptide (TPR) repeat protein